VHVVFNDNDEQVRAIGADNCFGAEFCRFGVLSRNFDLFFNSRFIFETVSAGTLRFAFSVPKLASADEIKPNSSEPQTHGSDCKEGCKKHQPFVVIGNSFFGGQMSFFLGLAIATNCAEQINLLEIV
jgi:hypothetical protein